MKEESKHDSFFSLEFPLGRTASRPFFMTETFSHLDIYYVCSECAKKKGAKWPSGHEATFHHAVCGLCKEFTDVAHYRNWDWPDDKRPSL